jgi:hypothetical protein
VVNHQEIDRPQSAIVGSITTALPAAGMISLITASPPTAAASLAAPRFRRVDRPAIGGLARRSGVLVTRAMVEGT